MEEGSIVFELEGKDSGLIIGRRGETLSSIEYLVRLIASKNLDKRANVMIDVEDYKLRRKEDFIVEKTILSLFKLKRLRQMLHAHELSFAHPKSGQRISLRGELSPDFLNLLSNLEKYKTSL